MDKIKINNEIVLLRKNVLQAKTHVVKRLIREALKLRQKKGTEAQKAKNVRKAKRLGAEIMSIKKIKKDEITKFVLKNKLTLEEILQNPNSKPLTRIIARIGNHKTFKTKVDEFKSKYPDCMKFLSSEKQKKSMLEQKIKLNLQIVTNELITETENLKSSVDDDTSQLDTGKNESSKDVNENNETQDKKEDEQIETKSKIVKNESIANAKNLKSRIDDQKSEHKKDNNDLKHNLNKNISKPLKKQNKDEDANENESETENEKESDTENEKESDTENENEGDAENVNKSDIENENESDTENKDISEIEDEDEPKIKIEHKKEVDAFFVMDDGETNYECVVPAKSKLADMEEDDYDNKSNFTNQRFPRPQNTDSFSTNFRNNNSNKFNSANKFNSTNKFKLSSKSNYNSSRFNSSSDYQQKNTKSFEKNKVGNRIDFKKNNFQNKSDSFKRKSNFEDDNKQVLHPSWEAKRKQQEMLKKGFQGKKIVFDDNL